MGIEPDQFRTRWRQLETWEDFPDYSIRIPGQLVDTFWVLETLDEVEGKWWPVERPPGVGKG